MNNLTVLNKNGGTAWPFMLIAVAVMVMLLARSIAYASEPELGETDETNGDTSKVEEVIVLGRRKALYSVITEDAQKLIDMPGSFGDPLGAISALPGVITPVGNQGTGAPAVRGSSPEDNRYYIDSMPAGYIFHQFNTSIFDANVIQNFQLFSAGFGAQYSNVTGAVFDVRLRDPTNIPIETTINLSLLRAGVFIESGVTENSSFYLSARKGLVQYFIPEEDEANDDGFRVISSPEDSDYQAKYMWAIDAESSLTLTLAGATDYTKIDLTDTVDLVQENPDFLGDATLKSKFNSQGISWGKKLGSNNELKLNLANYQATEGTYYGEGYFIDGDLNDVILSGHFRTSFSRNHLTTFGFEYNDYQYDYKSRNVLFLCTDFDVTCQDKRGELIDFETALTLVDSALYAIDNWQVTGSLNVEAGFQWSSNNYTNKNFLLPRISMEWYVWDETAITGSAGRYSRLPDFEKIMPHIGNPELKTQHSDHFSLGLKGELGDNIDWSLEAYHKTLSDLPLASEPGKTPLYSNDVEGTAQGLDFFINRNLADNWYGWMSLSYSVSERTNTVTNETQDYVLNTPLVLNVVGSYQISEKWNAGFRFTAKSGQSTTEIKDVKENPDFEGHYLPVYGEPYEDRLPVYSQLDLRVERTVAWFGEKGSFYIDILNALNRENVSARALNYEKVNEAGELHTKEETGNGIFPSIGISFSF